MAKIHPFRALRYDPARVSPADVVTQPYDKISPAMQDRYYAASPYNLVRIILGKAEPGDDEQNNVYTRAAASLQHWRADHVLVRDAEPSIYLYTLAFNVPGDPAGTQFARRGFIAAGQLEEYANQVVFRHEQTLSKPKADRLNLLRATQCHFGQIFMLYSDPAGSIDSMLQQNRPPDVAVSDEYGVVHRLWKISDPAIIEKVQASMDDKKLIIADGHHRYETALNYRNEMRRQGTTDANAPFEHVMMTLVNMDSPGLVILPTHRVAFGLDGFDAAAMNAKLLKNFNVEALGPITELNATMYRLREAGNRGSALLAVTGVGAFLFRSHSLQNSPALAGLSQLQRGLDVVQLHRLILEETLGMSAEDIRNQSHLKYVREAREAIEEVREGANVAFLMNPVRMEQVRDIAFSGEVLPQKSTDFFPKLLSGLTIYSSEDGALQSVTGAH
jgi:uncharacterized protein (DUF1015 family)